MYVCRVCRHHSPCEGFVKTPLPVKGFSKHLSLWRVFQNPSPCEGFFKTPLPVKGFSKHLSLWRVFQNSSSCEGFFKTPLPVKGFSKPFSLWGVFQDPSVCMHVCMLSMQASRSSKNQVSTRLSGMLQNTYGNKGLDTLFGPGRILDFWAPIVKNIRVFVHQSKNPHRQRGFEHTYTPEGCSATVQNPSACEGFWSVELCMYVC